MRELLTELTLVALVVLEFPEFVKLVFESFVPQLESIVLLLEGIQTLLEGTQALSFLQKLRCTATKAIASVHNITLARNAQ